jgi:hypothetical protein
MHFSRAGHIEISGNKANFGLVVMVALEHGALSRYATDQFMLPCSTRRARL